MRTGILCLCLCLCVELVICQFGFYPPREDRRQNQYGLQNIFPNPSRIRTTLSGILNFYPGNQHNGQGLVTPFNNKPTNYDIYGRPVNEPNNQYQYYDTPNQDTAQNNGHREDYTPNQNNQENGAPEQGAEQVSSYSNQNPNPLQVNQQNENLPQIPNRHQEFIAPNTQENKNEPSEEKQNGDTLIVIPYKEPSPTAFENVDSVVFPDGQMHNEGVKEVTEPLEVTTALVVTEATTEANPELPPLTPVPATESRNNFNFGPSGIFQETCQTVDNDIGSCVTVSECQPYLQLIQQSRSNPNALAVLRRAHCGFQGNMPKVCCPRPGIPTGPPPTLPTTTTTTTTTPAPTPAPTPSTGDVVTIPEPPVCGTSNASLSRVVGGVNSKLGDFPWMALLGYKSRRNSGVRWLCGGSLVTSRHVLTAAHCIHTREDDLYVVRLGELDLAREDEGATPIDVLIQRHIKHEQYSPKSFTNDIGILVLQTTVTFTDLIKPVCIPRDATLRANDFYNYNPFIAGWGDTEFRGPSATHLQVLQLPVVSNADCAQAYSAYKAQVIDHRVLCAGYKKGGKDACQGDSGGPLMQPIWTPQTTKTYIYQIGVVSYGKKCAEAGFPGVYTRVTEFVPWIEEKLTAPL